MHVAAWSVVSSADSAALAQRHGSRSCGVAPAGCTAESGSILVALLADSAACLDAMPRAGVRHTFPQRHAVFQPGIVAAEDTGPSRHRLALGGPLLPLLL